MWVVTSTVLGGLGITNNTPHLWMFEWKGACFVGLAIALGVFRPFVSRCDLCAGRGVDVRPLHYGSVHVLLRTVILLIHKWLQ